MYERTPPPERRARVRTAYFLLLVLFAYPAASAEAPPHVLVILVDDMGYGDPGCFNPDSKIPTPHVDSLAAEGMRFTDAHAPGPLCHMSRYGLLTGRYPFRTDVSRWPRQPLIDEGQLTVASLLRDNGYRTAMVGKWHCGFEEDGYDKPLPGGPVDRGFDSFFGIRASTDIPPYFYIRDSRAVQPPTDHIEANNSDRWWSPIQGKFWREGGIAPNLELKDVLPRFTDEAIEVIDEHAAQETDRPLFLYLAYPAPHTPWLPSPEFEGKSGAGLYGDFMMMVDAEIGRVLQTLSKRGMDRDTLVIFTSDNGPVWYDRDVERFGHDSAGPLRGMKADAWEAGHRMPFVVRWPGKVAPGSTSDQLLCFTDLLATFADILERPLPADAGPDSFSFLPALVGHNAGETPTRGSIVMRSGRGFDVVRRGRWKLINALGSGGFSDPKKIQPGEGEPQGQLYDLESDLGETRNLYGERPDVVRQLTSYMKEVQQSGQHRQ